MKKECHTVHLVFQKLLFFIDTCLLGWFLPPYNKLCFFVSLNNWRNSQGILKEFHSQGIGSCQRNKVPEMSRKISTSAIIYKMNSMTQGASL